MVAVWQGLCGHFRGRWFPVFLIFSPSAWKRSMSIKARILPVISPGSKQTRLRWRNLFYSPQLDLIAGGTDSLEEGDVLFMKMRGGTDIFLHSIDSLRRIAGQMIELPFGAAAAVNQRLFAVGDRAVDSSVLVCDQSWRTDGKLTTGSVLAAERG